MTNFIKRKNVTMTVYDDVAEGLKETYKKKLLPLEKETRYHEIQSPMMEDPDFDGKPLVMLIGQYSTGKTTFIRSDICNVEPITEYRAQPYKYSVLVSVTHPP